MSDKHIHNHQHHDEDCDCGCHKHNHHNHHDDNCDCGCHEHEHHHHHELPDRADGQVHVERRMHESACVVSGQLDVYGHYDDVRPIIDEKLGEMAKAIQAKGGIIGHIKVSANIDTVEMFSVTDVDVMVKTAPAQKISLNMAAIVFSVEPEETERMVFDVLSSVRDMVQ